MKKEIEDLIQKLDSGKINNEGDHIEYEGILEKFILNYDPALLPLMKDLIAAREHINFWYA